jgi:hypothetical protein
MRSPKKKEAKELCLPTASTPVAKGVSAIIASGRSIFASFAASSRSFVATVEPSSEAADSSCLSRRFFLFSAMRARASATISSSVYPASGEKPFALRISDAADMVLRRWCVGVR